MLALLLLACAPTPPAYTPDLTAYAGPEAACLQKHCAASASEEAFGACRAASCAPTPETWSVNPTLLRYEKGVVTMSVEVAHEGGAVGDVAVPPDADTFLGATVITSSGEEIDMAVQTVFPDRLGEPFTFSSEVGEGVEVVIVGLWGKKIEPCDSTRSGCQMFGFVLDESLAAWPEGTYSAAPKRQRFLPGEMAVKVSAAGMDEAQSKGVRDALAAVFAEEGKRFGTAFTVGEWAPDAAAPPSPASAVLHRHAHDGPLAARLAKALSAATGAEVAATHDPAAATDLVVALGTAACAPGLACR